MQGPCYDFMQQPYRDMVGNTTLYNCMKNKLEGGTLPACAAMGMATMQCMPSSGGGGGGMWGGRRGGHVADPNCSPGQPGFNSTSIPFPKETYDTMILNIFKGGQESRCDPDNEIKAEDRDK